MFHPVKALAPQTEIMLTVVTLAMTVVAVPGQVYGLAVTVLKPRTRK